MDLSLSGIVASFFVGAIGFVLFHYGRKCARTPQLVSGVALMAFPPFVPGVGWMLCVAALILAACWACVRSGM